MKIDKTASEEFIKELSESNVYVEYVGKEVIGTPILDPFGGIIIITDKSQYKNVIFETYRPFSLTFNKKYKNDSDNPFYTNADYSKYIRQLKSNMFNEIDRNISLKLGKWEILDYTKTLNFRLTEILNQYYLHDSGLRYMSGKICYNTNCKYSANDEGLNNMTDNSVANVASNFFYTQVSAIKEINRYLEVRQQVIEETDDYLSKISNIKNIVSAFTWNKTDTDLLELIIALIEFKAIQNNSNTLTQKEAFNTFSDIFNIEIKDSYKKLNAARKRKKEGEIPFLLKLQNKLEEYYKKQDEKNP